ncbi:MAG: hypothetical protein NW224_17735 [Leptolyngbyaceae cyanobacterium bins.302]|nr:hypothetical protein [Leptolyngbyaceae cyanobacterium bins.302]
MVTFSVLMLSGCDESLISDVKEFDKVVSDSALSVKKTYSGVNDFCRQCYVTKLRFNPSARIKHRKDDADNSPDVLMFAYSPEDIRARELALEGLIEYSAGLMAIAGSDSPKQAGELAAQISERLGSTADSLSRLNEMSKSTKDGQTTFKFESYSKPIATLAKLAAEKWVGKKQKDNLKECITSGYADTEATFDLLEEDLKNLWKFAYKQNAELTLLAQENYYNYRYVRKDWKRPAIDTPDYEKYVAFVGDKSRLDLLNEIRDSAKSFSTLFTSSPEPLISRMRESHQRLKKYADEGKIRETGIIDPNGKADDQDLRDKSKGMISAMLDSYRQIKMSLYKNEEVK